jgi:hypothetical protein
MSKSGNSPKRAGAKVTGGTKLPDVRNTRQTLHLGEQTVKRLGVHCSLVGRDRSAVANEILVGWLARFGKGREIFDSPDSVDLEDREDGAPGANDSGKVGTLPRGL